jgi:hypothetical protein
MQKIQFFRGPFSKRKHGRILSAVCRADMLKFKAKKICFDEKVCLLLINFLYIMTRFQFVQFFLSQNVNMAAFSAVCRADMLEFKAKKICFDEKVCLLLINF